MGTIKTYLLMIVALFVFTPTFAQNKVLNKALKKEYKKSNACLLPWASSNRC